MDISGDIIKYVQNSERLIVVSIVLFLSGIIAYWTEQQGIFSFASLPDWVRPAGMLGWIASGVHVVIRLLISLGAAFKHITQFVVSFPSKRRQAAADQPTINRLLAMEGIAKEVLCYARHRDNSCFWVGSSDRLNWLRQLKRAGLVELSDAGFDRTVYRIHRIAWKYMKKYPNRFLCAQPWENAPWASRLNEQELEKLFEAA